MKHISFLVKILILSAAFQSASAYSFQSHQSIAIAIDHFLDGELMGEGRETTVKVGKIDPRLRLKKCEAPLTVSLPVSSRRIGAVTVKVSCTGESSWSIYVQNEVEQFGEVMVAKRNLQRKEIISREDIEPKRVSLGAVRGGYITKMDNILGWEVKRNIAMGKTISPNTVRRPLWVKKGDIVVLVAKNKRFEVKMSGVAQSQGGKGETVRVVNQSSKKVVEGVVIAPGVVQVPM